MTQEISWNQLMNDAAFGVAKTHETPGKGWSDVPVSTWTMHGKNCTAKHRSAKTFMECALYRWEKNISGEWHRTSVRVSGSGIWAVVHHGQTENYYQIRNNVSKNLAYGYYDVWLFETYEEAKKMYADTSASCWLDGCNGRPCRQLKNSVIKVSL